MGLADPAHRAIGRLSFDPYAIMLAHLAMTLSYLGYIDQGRSRMAEALSEARRLRQAHMLAHVLTMVNWFDEAHPLAQAAHRGSSGSVERSTVSLITWVWPGAHRGRSLISLGQTQEGFALLK